MRRRLGLTLEAVASDLGLGKYWVNCMELGKVPCERLQEYLRERIK